MQDVACRGIDYPGVYTPPCRSGGTYDPRFFPGLGDNNAELHPPTYYALTAPPALLLTVVGFDSLLDAGRLVGILWLGFGLITVWLTLEELGIGGWQQGIVLALLATSPAVLHPSSTVNNDATAILAGGLVLLATLKWERGGWGIWPLVGAVLVAAALKSTNVLAITACATYLIVRSFANDHRPDRRRYWFTAGLMLTVGAVGILWWAALHSAIARAPTTTVIDWFRTDTLRWDQVLDQWIALVTPARIGSLPTLLGSRLSRGLALLVSVGIVLSVLVAASRWITGRRDEAEALGVVGGVAMATSGPLLAVANFVILGIYFGIPTRYGLSLMPLLAVATGALLRRPVVLWAAGLLAAGSVASTLIGLTTFESGT
jgi:hypothetical protein